MREEEGQRACSSPLPLDAELLFIFYYCKPSIQLFFNYNYALDDHPSGILYITISMAKLWLQISFPEAQENWRDYH